MFIGFRRIGGIGRMIFGRRRGAQEETGPDTSAKADQRKDHRDEFAQHDQNGATMSATCWPYVGCCMSVICPRPP